MNKTVDSRKEAMLISDKKKDIAVIGIALQLPGANNLSDFWNIVSQGKCLFSEIPPDRKNDLADYLEISGQRPDSKHYERGAYLEHIDEFDYNFFTISPKEALSMDPAQRIFLQTAWHAIEDAGYTKQELKRHVTGVYVAHTGDNQYFHMAEKLTGTITPQNIVGNLSPFMSGRIAHILDLQGPNMVINTLCSSSLTALHVACKAIKNNECEMAVVGGIQIHTIPIRNTTMGMESADVIRAFDDDASGTSAGEGAVVFVLKALRQAECDRDSIYAVIKGSAVNHDGTSTGLTAPNPVSQSKLLVSAWKDSGINPVDISYIETHGTGTKLGDPIEIEGIRKAFSHYTNKKQFCAIGSVKTNIGHLDAAAGGAGILKAILSLRHKQIPPTLHFRKANKYIDFLDSPVYVNDLLISWNSDNSPRRCGVSSFGLSGTNCHVVLEEYEPLTNLASMQESKEKYIFVLSAKRFRDLQSLTYAYLQAFINYDNKVGDICFTSCIGRAHYKFRIAVIVESIDDIKEKLGVLYYNNFTADIKNGIYCNLELPEKSDGFCPIEGDIDFSLRSLCMSYIKGENIEWQSLYCEGKYSRVNLPGYPFSSERVWIDLNNSNSLNEITRNSIVYSVEWIKKPVGYKQVTTKRDVLLIGEELSLLEFYKSELEKTSRKVITFHSNFDCNLNGVTSYTQLSHHNPNEVVLLLSSGNMSWQENMKDAFMTAEKSLRFLIQNTARLVSEIEATVYIVSFNSVKVTLKDNLSFTITSIIQGYMTALVHEHPNLQFRFIDLEDIKDVGNIIHDMNYISNDYFIAYRDRKRYVRILADYNSKKLEKIKLSKNGVYIIAGGGDIGMQLASKLALSHRLNLAVITNWHIPPQQEWDSYISGNQYIGVEKIYNYMKIAQEIIGNNSKIKFYCADLCSRKQLSKVLEHIKSDFGEIKGIFYTAGKGIGLHGNDVIEERADDAFAVMMPKTYGICLLDQLTRKDRPFIAAFSSAISLVGGKGSGCYSAANSFLNYFADYRNQQGIPTNSFILAPWEKSVQLGVNRKNFLFEPISIVDIEEALMFCIGTQITNVVVGKLNPKCADMLRTGIFPINIDFKLMKLVKSQINTLNRETMKSTAKISLLGRESSEYTLEERRIALIFLEHLGHKIINISDSFYQLGGDSITGIKIVYDINREFGIEIKIKDLLEHPIFSDFTEYVSNTCKTKTTTLIPAASKLKQYVLSTNQMQFYLHSKAGMDKLCHMPDLKVITGLVDTVKLEYAIRQIIKRHQVFRMSIQEIDGTPMQVVEDSTEFNLEIKKIEMIDLQIEIEALFQPFDLTKPPLFRIKLLNLTPTKHYLLINIHHIVSDGITKNIVTQDLIDFYNGIVKNPLQLQYIDYVYWHNQLDFELHKKFWLNMYEGYKQINSESKSYIDKNWMIRPGKTVEFSLKPALTTQLQDTLKKESVSLFVLLFAAYTILYSAYTNRSDVVIGTVYSGRNHPDLQEIAGVFINTLPVRVICESNLPVNEYIQNIHKLLMGVVEYQDFSIQKILNLLHTRQLIHDRNLYDTVFIMQNIKTKAMNLPGINILEQKLTSKYARMDLTIEVKESEGKVLVQFEYNSEKFNNNIIQLIAFDYMNILEDICSGKSTTAIISKIRRNKKFSWRGDF